MSKNKNVKKNNYQLKFQLSSINLECFMKKKSVSMTQSDPKKRKKSKGKITSYKKKLPEFQQDNFITSIIKNAMQDEFEDPKQVTQLLNKIHIEHEDKLESPTNQEDLLKSFEIFKEPIQRFTPEIGFFPQLPLQKIQDKKQQYPNHPNTGEFQLGKQAQSNNFSTQIQSQITSQRSKKQQIQELYKTLPIGQYYIPIKGYTYQHQPQNLQKQPYLNNESPNNNMFRGLSKEQRHRKSTPIPQNREFQINLDKVEYDGRTTVMIRHIPNKYTQQMLIDEINVNHKHKYNFFYLPLDSYNPCNVGYAFINFIDTKFIAKFYLQFNKKRWNKFNSEKICQLAYARIQGSKALINHFENSNVMHCRDRRYRPFISFGDNMRT